MSLEWVLYVSIMPLFLSLDMLTSLTSLSDARGRSRTPKAASGLVRATLLARKVAHFSTGGAHCKHEKAERPPSIRGEDYLRLNHWHVRAVAAGDLRNGQELPGFAFHPTASRAETRARWEDLPNAERAAVSNRQNSLPV